MKGAGGHNRLKCLDFPIFRLILEPAIVRGDLSHIILDFLRADSMNNY